MKRVVSVNVDAVLTLGYLIIVAVILAVVVYIGLTSPTYPTAIEVFGTRFDECMATERFTREECIAYADEGE